MLKCRHYSAGAARVTLPNGWELYVWAQSVGLYDGANYIRSRAAWFDGPDGGPHRPWIAAAAWPDTMRGLVAAALDGGPAEALVDYLLDEAPEPLRAALDGCLAAA